MAVFLNYIYTNTVGSEETTYENLDGITTETELANLVDKLLSQGFRKLEDKESEGFKLILKRFLRSLTSVKGSIDITKTINFKTDNGNNWPVTVDGEMRAEVMIDNSGEISSII
ncbi:hypothetical protein [Clostridium sp.]|uniref:hypothetical protein n=1 Tax=Clostridium sp. TaxID=1506 RepID=UPI0025807A56|nr:hypothetical protein [Clostridium sp.]MBE6057482.1 hypothetical protein [Clostridium sp.]